MKEHHLKAGYKELVQVAPFAGVSRETRHHFQKSVLWIVDLDTVDLDTR